MGGRTRCLFCPFRARQRLVRVVAAIDQALRGDSVPPVWPATDGGGTHEASQRPETFVVDWQLADQGSEIG